MSLIFISEKENSEKEKGKLEKGNLKKIVENTLLEPKKIRFIFSQYIPISQNIDQYESSKRDLALKKFRLGSSNESSKTPDFSSSCALEITMYTREKELVGLFKLDNTNASWDINNIISCIRVLYLKNQINYFIEKEDHFGLDYYCDNFADLTEKEKQDEIKDIALRLNNQTIPNQIAESYYVGTLFVTEETPTKVSLSFSYYS